MIEEMKEEDEQDQHDNFEQIQEEENDLYQNYLKRKQKSDNWAKKIEQHKKVENLIEREEKLFAHLTAIAGKPEQETNLGIMKCMQLEPYQEYMMEVRRKKELQNQKE